jgi:hypothetical protein
MITKRTAPHRTAPHRTAPRCFAPRHTASQQRAHSVWNLNCLPACVRLHCLQDTSNFDDFPELPSTGGTMRATAANKEVSICLPANRAHARTHAL